MVHSELCPYCGRNYENATYENFRRKEFVDAKYHKEYVQLLNKKFGDKAWPFCLNCYYDLVELCNDCGMVLEKSPIYWLSSALKDMNDHQCSICYEKASVVEVVDNE